MTREKVQLILQKYFNIWNSANHGCHLWVALANPRTAITIPDIAFGITSRYQPIWRMRSGMSPL